MPIDSNITKEEFLKLQAKAEKGDREAQYAVGVAYRNGWGIKANLEIAFSWLMDAAERGSAQAQAFIGKNYSYAWIMRAAKKRNAKAQAYIGNIYSTGKCVKQNYSIAIEWYLKSFNNGYTHAAELLAKTYIQLADELSIQISDLSTKREKYKEYYYLWLAKGIKANDMGCENIMKKINNYYGIEVDDEIYFGPYYTAD